MLKNCRICLSKWWGFDWLLSFFLDFNCNWSVFSSSENWKRDHFETFENEIYTKIKQQFDLIESNLKGKCILLWSEFDLTAIISGLTQNIFILFLILHHLKSTVFSENKVVLLMKFHWEIYLNPTKNVLFQYWKHKRPNKYQSF